MNEHTKIIEINGVKLEVDMRYARTVDQYKIGQCVKVLKKSYGDTYDSYPGVIIGFENFKNLPSINIAYACASYDADIKFVLLNAQTKDIEICPMINDELPFTRAHALASFERKIRTMKAELIELEDKRDYFLERFGEFFPVTPTE
jgi:hypothetical protein